MHYPFRKLDTADAFDDVKCGCGSKIPVSFLDKLDKARCDKIRYKYSGTNIHLNTIGVAPSQPQVHKVVSEGFCSWCNSKGDVKGLPCSHGMCAGCIIK